ncbi:MAG: hypothetical protein FWE01_01610 [Firmicutes bacterium]|nr:hypothetical protein [Bacillota bacterium]
MHNTIIRKSFLGSNTPNGFVGFFDKLVDNYPLEKVYILKGGSGVGKSTFIKKFTKSIIENHPKTSFTIDYFMCSADPDSYDGVIIHELGLAIIDGTSPHIVDPKFPGLVEEIIDLAKFLDTKKINITKQELATKMQKRREHFDRAFAELNAARTLHLDVENIFSNAMNFDGVNQLLETLIKKHTLL